MDTVKPIVKDLGWCIARGNAMRTQLTICSPSDESDGYYAPGSSVRICNRANIEALRDLCIEILNEENKSS